MKKLLSLSLCFSTLLFNMLASAAQPGAYAGLGLGYGKQHTPSLLDESFIKKDNGGLSGRMFAGYNFNEYVGLEGGLTHYADATYKLNISNLLSVKQTDKLNTLDLVGKVYLPIPETGFNLYALGGAALAHVQSRVEATGYPDDKSTSNIIRPIFGAGASYDIPNTALSTNLEFTRIQGNHEEIQNTDLATINLVYHFN